jgi:hypothetical protein
MIKPINLEEYMSVITRKYQYMPEGEEKNNLWLEIKKLAEKQYPSIQIDEISDDDINNDNNV